MLCESIYLREDEGCRDVILDTYVTTKRGDMDPVPPRDAVVVLPGGAYCFLAEREGEPVAKEFLQRGFNAFVLYYSIGDKENGGKFPRPLVDVSLAVAHLKRNAEKYNINPDRIFICGFSAGGHLAGAAGTLWHTEMAAFPGMKEYENKPCGVILAYPASSLMEYGHDTCRTLICGTAEPTEEEKMKYSLECLVSEDTVPHFIWQTEEDNCVPVENSVLLTAALVKARVPVEYHLYPFGPHGMSTAKAEVIGYDQRNVNDHVATWVELAYQWTQITGREN